MGTSISHRKILKAILQSMGGNACHRCVSTHNKCMRYRFRCFGWSIYSFSGVVKFVKLIKMAENSAEMRVIVLGRGPSGKCEMTIATAPCASHGHVTGKNWRKKQAALDAIAKERLVRDRIDKAKASFNECTPVSSHVLSGLSSLRGYGRRPPESLLGPYKELYRSPDLNCVVLPFNMHHVMCTLLTGDKDNAFMEGVLRSLPRHDGSPEDDHAFPNVRNLLCTAKFPVADVFAEWVEFIPYIIQNINARAKTSTGAVLLSNQAQEPFRVMLARHVVRRAMYGFDPRETASAIAVIIFMMYSSVRLVNTATTVAGFVANTILLSEGFAPIPPHILESGTFGAALALDAAAWDKPAAPASCVSHDGETSVAPRLRSSITSTCNLLTSLRKACDACGNMQSSAAKCMLRCSRCRFAVYCSKQCQKSVYKSHKPFCDDNVCA